MKKIPALVLLLAFSMSISLAWSAPLQDSQQDPSQLGSLTKVPQSAGFYYATMNHEALYDAVFESNAYKAIKASDVSKGLKKAYRRGKTRGYADYNEENPLAQYLQFYGDYLDNFVVNSSMEVVKQVVGNELFVYVDNDGAKLAHAIQKAQKKMSQLISEDISAFDEQNEFSEEQMSQIIREMMKQLEDVDCPTMIMGARLEDPEGFKGMLELTRSAAESGMENLPPDADFIRRGWKVIDEEDKFLMTLRLDLEDLPWKEILAEIDDPNMQVAIEDFIFDKRATLALGIVDNILFFGAASEAKNLVEFGKGDRLIDLPELTRLEQAVQSNEAITSVYYISDEYSNIAFFIPDSIEFYIPLWTKMIEQEESLPEKERKRLAKQVPDDLQEFVTDMRSMFSEPAMRYSFTKLGAEGIQGYSFTKSVHPMVDSSKPLELGKHAGPNTIAFMAQRPKDLAKQYGIAAKWMSKIYGYVTPTAMEQVEYAAERAAKREHTDFDEELYN